MKAEIVADLKFSIGEIDERLYGSFIEHMGRAVYGGIYQPDHPSANEKGFRKDVIELVKALNVPIIRYPGGNFVSNYNWEDGIGPKENRPKVTDAAWTSIEPNYIGTDEFHDWANEVGAEVMMAVNLGTGSIDGAKNLLEYCNLPNGSKYSDMRRQNGREKPYADKVWCLGNEMDGPWQVGGRTIEDYADIARKASSVMKRMDPSIELVACGSSNYYMKTFGKWELAVLEAAYENIEYVSLHEYYWKEGDDRASYLASSVGMDAFIETVSSICDTVKGICKSKKRIHLSFDEWNVWNLKTKCNNDLGRWTIGPRREEFLYSMEDAIAFGGLLTSLINHSDRVKIACLAQLVNVAAPIMAEKTGNAWAQTIYYPFMHASLYGRGVVLRTLLDCPTYVCEKYGEVKYLAASAVYNEKDGTLAIFVVNRSEEENCDLRLTIRGDLDYEVVEHIAMFDRDPNAMNTFADPTRVRPFVKEKPFVEGNKIFACLEPMSWNVIRLKTRTAKEK